MKKLLIFVIVGVLALGIGTSIQVRANPIQDYEVIERINYTDDNWEFTTIPFTPNDNWNEYGLRYYLVDESDNIFSDVCYISAFTGESNVDGLYTYFYLLTHSDMNSGINITFVITDLNFGATSQIKQFEVLEGISDGWRESETSWVELIRVIPNIDTKYNEGFNEGYSRGVSQNFSSFGSFLTNSVGGFLNFEIFPGFSIMNVLWAILGVLLFIIILRVFAGG